MIESKTVIEDAPVVRFRLARDLFGRPFYHTAAYWVNGLLIDTGPAHTSRPFVAALTPYGVDQVVNTHSHEDHIGANADVQRRFRSPILAHKDALPILANPRLQPLQPYRRLFWGWPRASIGSEVGQSVETPSYCFQVIPTPGHSPDHICLFEPEQGWLFTGDAYIGGQDRALRAGYDIHGIIDSLRRLAHLPVSVILSGSGTVRTGAQSALREKISYLEKLGEQILALADQGWAPDQIPRRLFGRAMPITYITLGHFSASHLVRSFLMGSGRPV